MLDPVHSICTIKVQQQNYSDTHMHTQTGFYPEITWRFFVLQSMSIISNTSHTGFWICASLMRCSMCKQKQWDLQNVLTRRSKSATARYNLSCTLKSTCHITSHILLETPADNSQMHGRGNDLSCSAVVQRGTFSVFSLVLVGVTF